jgi:hypothetical protein
MCLAPTRRLEPQLGLVQIIRASRCAYNVKVTLAQYTTTDHLVSK